MFAFPVSYGAETFIGIARPFMANYLDMFEFYGTRGEQWKPILLRSIPASQLSPTYGGDNGWTALPMNGSAVHTCEQFLSVLRSATTALLIVKEMCSRSKTSKLFPMLVCSLLQIIKS